MLAIEESHHMVTSLQRGYVLVQDGTPEWSPDGWQERDEWPVPANSLVDVQNNL